ncbi:competence/damage-inducible protein A [Parasulfuritortus cantonensis]|uniref:Competence/damage-inducible protein A n=1 Tax=Parasulfuritortus cantonensis TaxID=2528202 RepID=A0A4R1BGY4_9PROT|nr:molybdopterin-binding protein [Parasulfuritortus cantonensis]TCJ16358.1 competence/damage-inducible protein A [Parasulfuritortus cantonensis]
MSTSISLLIIGDEILSGKRQDKHFARVREILAERGLHLAQVSVLGDDRARLTTFLRTSFAGDDIVFSCGGIGATPDDHTRQAAAAALGAPLVLHPEAEALISARSREVGLPVTPGRLEMGEFPAGASIIPNPVNRIPGFSVGRHHFVPGFPEMAWPMIEWVLDTRYRDRFHGHDEVERAFIVRGLAEATLTPLMLEIERDHPGIKVFSLPILNPVQPDDYKIELGVKGPVATVDAAFARLRAGTLDLAGRIE